MKLVFYSGGEWEDCEELDAELIRMSGKRRPSITYIPSSSEYGKWEFGEFVHHFRRYNLSQFAYLPVDSPSTEMLIEEAFLQDIIHLSGGNTFYFLNCLRKGGFIPRLKEFVRRGGVLSGLSAGAILMTPTIHTAGFPEFDCDENTVRLRNLKSLKLVDFEFFPHFRNSRRYRAALAEYSAASPRKLYACPDGAGIVIEGAGMRLCGKTLLYSGGRAVWKRPGLIVRGDRPDDASPAV